MKNIENFILKGATVLGIAIAGTALNSCSARRITPRYPIQKEILQTIPKSPVKKVLEKKITEAPIQMQIPNAPVYNYPNENCAAYAIRTARDIFHKNFKYSDAWNARYNNRIVTSVKDKTELTDLIEKSVLKPGMIVGVYYPFSNYLNKTDQKGKKVKYTHLAVFAGVNKKNEPVFYHQFRKKETKVTLKKLIGMIGSIKKILDEK